MKQKHLEYFRLNKSILIAVVGSVIASAIVAQSLEKQADTINATSTLIVDYVVYFSIFGVLYYYDNRKKYKTSSNKINKKLLQNDLVKIISSLGVSEVVYIVVRWTSQFYLLGIDYDPYLASIVSHVISTIIYMISVNLSIKITRLYND